jgi:predicted Zn-dependent peptidase
MVLLGQRMESVASASLTLAVQAGAAHDPPTAAGAASVAEEWSLRGAADRNTRQLNDALDALGCQHSQHVQSEHVLFSAGQLGRNLPEVLGLVADVVLRPRLEDETFEPCRELTRQDLESLSDEPARQCMLLLRERFYGLPLGRCIYGTSESLEAMTGEGLREHWRGSMRPRGAIFGVAGAFDWQAISERVEGLFGEWNGGAAAGVAAEKAPRGVVHVEKDTAQVHVAMAHPAATFGHRGYYAARMAEMVLSGGAGSRLHTEVREKRGLAYHVGCHYHSLRTQAGMFTYEAATPRFAQEMFDLTVREIRRLEKGIGEDELARARTQLKSSLIMQNESTGARAHALAGDWYHLGRLRSFGEIASAVESVTAADVLDYLREFPARDFTVLVVGPKALDMSVLGE